jgi:hypothetical protein
MEPIANASGARAHRSMAKARRAYVAPRAGHDLRGTGAGLPERSATERAAYLELLSHELRTPVTSIYAAVTILRTRARQVGEALQAELVDDIAEETERLLRTIGDVLMLAQLETGIPLVREPLPLPRLVPLLLSAERRRRPGVDIEIVHSGPIPPVEGDEAAVVHVMRDLLAETGASSGGFVKVELSASDPAGAEVRFVGRGPTRSVSFGLSRYASHRVMEAMGGRTWARRLPGGRVERGLWLPAFGPMVDD